MRAERVLPLDSLRGFAALGVTLFYHYSHFGAYRPFEGFWADWLYGYGFMLVDFFFVLSGFVLSHAYLEKLAARQVSPYQFFVLRFSRLYPLHLVTLLLVAGVQFYRHSAELDAFVYQANDLFHFILNLAFLQQGIIRTEYSFNGPAWSLTVEEVSYLLFFASMFFFSALRRLAFGTLVAVGVMINITGIDLPVLNLDVSRGLVGFFSGCLAYQVHGFAVRSSRGNILAGGSAVFLFGLVWYYVQHGYPRSVPTLLVHSMVIFPAIVLLVLNVPLLSQALSFRPLAYLGEISYSVYMIHFPVQLLMATADEVNGIGFVRGSVPFFLGYMSLTLGLSVASFHLFERRVQGAIRRRLLPDREA